MRAVREGASKKPSGSARIAHGSASCELEQVCCYVNPDFSVKMSDASEHYDSGKKKEKRGGHKIKCSLSELGRAGRENIWRSICSP